MGEDNTVPHAGTTVVSCQQSSQSSLQTNFLLVSWQEVRGFGGTKTKSGFISWVLYAALSVFFLRLR